MNLFKRAALYLSVAFSNVEKAALGQKGEDLSDDANTLQRYRQGTLADDLLQGRLTEEVKLLRARTYKVIEAMDKKKVNITPIIDADGNVSDYQYSGLSEKNNSTDGIIYYDSDSLKPIMEIENRLIFPSFTDSIGLNIDEIKLGHTIMVERDVLPKFNLEEYTKKIIVKESSDNKFIIEFYVNNKPDKIKRTTYLFISEVKKLLNEPSKSDLTNIKEVGFITNSNAGVENGLEFQYKIEEIENIVEFSDFFVFRFIATPIVNGEKIYDKYKREDLDTKYQNKEARANNEK